jgi:hypothetical protein
VISIVFLGATFTYAQIAPDKTSGFIGTAFGTGRACSGHLTISPDWITWKMHFDSCNRVPYKIVKQEQSDKHKFVVYELEDKQKCPFHMITIEQRPELEGGVEAAGFSKGEDYEHDKWDIDCVLF